MQYLSDVHTHVLLWVSISFLFTRRSRGMRLSSCKEPPHSRRRTTTCLTDWGRRRCERYYESLRRRTEDTLLNVRSERLEPRRLLDNFSRRRHSIFLHFFFRCRDSDRWIEGWKCFLISKVFGDTFIIVALAAAASHLSSERTFYSTPNVIIWSSLLFLKNHSIGKYIVFLAWLSFIFSKKRECINRCSSVSLYSVAASKYPRGASSTEDGCLRRSRCVTQISSIPFG